MTSHEVGRAVQDSAVVAGGPEHPTRGQVPQPPVRGFVRTADIPIGQCAYASVRVTSRAAVAASVSLGVGGVRAWNHARVGSTAGGRLRQFVAVISPLYRNMPLILFAPFQLPSTSNKCRRGARVVAVDRLLATD